MANITLNVDDEVFNKIVEQELDNIPSDKLQDLIVDALRGYFEANDYKKAGELIYKERNNGYYKEEVPTDFAHKLIANCDCSKLQEIVDAAIDKLKNEHEKILREMLADMFSTGLINNYEFQSALRRTISDELMRIHNT